MLFFNPFWDGGELGGKSKIAGKEKWSKENAKVTAEKSKMQYQLHIGFYEMWQWKISSDISWSIPSEKDEKCCTKN